MADVDILSLLDQMPPDADIYSYLSAVVDDLAYPDLGGPFYVAAYISAGSCGLVILAIAAGLYLRWRRNRLQFVLHDGPATRPNPRVLVPIFWLITGIFLITHTFWLRACMKGRRLSYAIGVFWWMLPGGLIVSYSIIALSVLCSAPAIRKWLARLNERFGNDRYDPSVILINFILFAVCVVVSCLPYVAGRLTGQGFAYLDEAYRGAQALIATAQNEQNLAVLSSIQTYIDLFDKAKATDNQGVSKGGIIFSTIIVFFFFAGMIPTIFLNLYLRKRIARLDNGLTTSVLQQSQSYRQYRMTAFPMTFQSGGSDHDVEVLGDNIEAQASKKLDLGLKKLDRPFQNLTPTAMLPMNYASIFQAQVEPQEKARRLRRALRRDNLQLLAFMLLVAFLGSLAFFQAAKGPYQLDIKTDFQSSYLILHYGYLVPAFILAGAFLVDAIRTSNGSEDEAVDAQVSALASGHSFRAPPLASIQLSQTVEVVEEHSLQEKKPTYEMYSR